MSEKYTFDEICELRQEVLKHEAYKLGGWHSRDKVSLPMVEDMVRTYMQAGIRAADTRPTNEKMETEILRIHGHVK